MVEHSKSADSDEGGWQKREEREEDSSSASPSSNASKAGAYVTTETVVYLNNAGQAVLSKEVKEAGIRAMHDGLSPVDDDQNLVRELFANIIEAENPYDVAIMPSTAFAITFGARNVQRTNKEREGRIVLLQDQYNSAVYPWQQICEESNGLISLDIVSHPLKSTTKDKEGNDRNWTESILKHLDANVIAACIPPLHWSDGTLIDLETISKVCTKFDIILIVDGTQAVGIMPLSVQQIQPAMLACSVHKWLRGPPGTSLVYVSPTFHDKWLPLDFHSRGRDLQGGKAWDASNDEMGPGGYPEKFFQDARKFDSGGKANPLLLPMLRTALEQVVIIEYEKAQTRLQSLIEPLLDWVRQRNDDYHMPSAPHASHLIGIKPINQTPEETIRLCDRLRKEGGIVVAVRCGNIRISPYLDTTKMEIAKLVAALDAFTLSRCVLH